MIFQENISPSTRCLRPTRTNWLLTTFCSTSLSLPSLPALVWLVTGLMPVESGTTTTKTSLWVKKILISEKKHFIIGLDQRRGPSSCYFYAERWWYAGLLEAMDRRTPEIRDLRQGPGSWHHAQRTLGIRLNLSFQPRYFSRKIKFAELIPRSPFCDSKYLFSLQD